VTNNPVFLFFNTPANIGPTLLRLAAAGIFFVHGGQKAFGWFGGGGWTSTLATWTSGDGMGLPTMMVVLAVVGELAVSLALFFGFLTRVAGVGIFVLMAGALAVTARTTPTLAALEFPFLLWVVGISLVFLGGGRFSIDRAISRNVLPAIG